MGAHQRPPHGQPDSLPGHLVLDVRGVPELLAEARKQLAQVLRDAAEDEGPEVAAFAHRVAAAFEAGQEA